MYTACLQLFPIYHMSRLHRFITSTCTNMCGTVKLYSQVNLYFYVQLIVCVSALCNTPNN